MNTKHTNGGWEVYETGQWPETNHFYGISKLGGTGQVAKVEGWGKEAEAHARLIAAAPELLEALDGLIDAIYRNLDNDGATIQQSREYQAAEAAIAKARGGA